MSTINLTVGLLALIVTLSPIAANASFEETMRRYPSALGALELLKNIAPYRADQADACLHIGAASAPVLGAIDPLQIQPLETHPGALFFNYFEKCAKRIVILGFADEANARKNSELILGSDLTSSVTRANQARAFWTSQFANLPAETQYRLVDQFIAYLLGPEELLRYFKYIGEGNVFGAEISSPTDLRNFLIQKTGASGSVMDLYARTAVLLRLGPVLHN